MIPEFSSRENSEKWISNIPFVLAFSVGLVSHSLTGLFIGNMARMKEGVFPIYFLVPLLVALLAFLLWILFVRRNRTPRWFSLGSIFFLILSFFFGHFSSVVLWRQLGSWELEKVWREIQAAGYSPVAPADDPGDPSEENAVTWLERIEPEISKDGGKAAEKLSAFLRRAAQGEVNHEESGKVKELVAANQKALFLLKKAAACPKIRWKINRQKILNPEIPRMAYMLQLARLCACRSVLEQREGRYDLAMESVREILWLGHAAFEEKDLIGAMIGLAIDHIALDASQYRLEKLPWPGSGALVFPDPCEEALRRVDDSLGIELAWVPRQWGNAGSTQWADTLDWKNGTRWIGADIYWPFLGLDAASFLRNSKKILACLRRPFPEIKPCYEGVNEEFKKEGWLLAQISMPRFERMRIKALTLQARCRFPAMVLACRKYFQIHGKWPTSLQQTAVSEDGKDLCLDTFDGQPIRLLPAGRDLILYSVGPDGVDDGGKKIYEHNQGEEKGDIVWVVRLPVKSRR
jgi:hypothetical protein